MNRYLRMQDATKRSAAYHDLFDAPAPLARAQLDELH